MSRERWTSALFVVLFAASAAAQQPVPVNPRPGQEGHRTHKEWQGDYPSLEALKDFKVVRTFEPPPGFLGNLAYDGEANRLWLVSLGPPTSQTSSTLYEIAPDSGRVIRKTAMPFKGDLSEPVFANGYLYQSVFHESKMYKVSIDGPEPFGTIVKTIPLPTLNDLKLGDESHPVPFIEFGGVTLTPEKNLMIHADDVGELITMELETGKVLARVRTLKALGGISAVKTSEGRFLVLGNSDPRGGYCALSFPPALSRTPEQKDISWALIDPTNGEVLASIRTQNSRAYASTVELLKHDPMPGRPFGKMSFLATGEEGLVVLEWAPQRDTF